MSGDVIMVGGTHKGCTRTKELTFIGPAVIEADHPVLTTLRLEPPAGEQVVMTDIRFSVAGLWRQRGPTPARHYWLSP